MAAQKTQITQVGKRKIELTNLTKLIYPDDQLTKAHLIEYYFKMAPAILAHVKGRPLSLVRYPDGIDGKSFFQKNRPEWAPEWIEHVTLGEEKKDYIVATEEATLVWLANLACIELHQMHSRGPHYDKPDYIVYDFDPPENFGFGKVIELALEFKEHLESFGYHSFVKTTGRKGLHVVTPIEQKWDFQTAFEAAKAVAQPFVESHSSALTLQIKKDRREGKALLDIYRNRNSQTIVAAYSARGLPGAPVSTPLTWDELSSVESPKAFGLLTVPQRIKESGDPWEGMAAYATAIHTERKMPASTAKKLPLARTRKTPEQLEKYASKRSFAKTSEPAPTPLAAGSGRAFVVHRHHASRLHYDLRLERDGVLRSWAVPKGLPPRPGIKRLAVSVEDHPLKYVDFEGAIPKGEYGGGMMWKFAQGRYEVTKEKKDGFYFKLNSRELTAEYRIYNTKENQWLLERLDSPQTDWLRERIEPMLAKPADKPPNSDDFQFELKWDGLRALIALDEGEMKVYGRNVLDFTTQFPELITPDGFRATNGLFDGEIVCLEADGRPNFRNVIHRMQQRGGGIERAKAKHPAVCYLFDCLYLDGRAIVNEPLTRRREWLADAVKKDGAYRVSEAMEDGPAFLEAAKQMGLEGIMAKRRDSVYQPGKRSDAWLKIKTRLTAECVIIGYTKGAGDRESTFGALHLAQKREGALKYVGKVGTGFDEAQMGEIWREIVDLTRIPRPVKEKPIDDAKSVWIEPRLVCEARYASLTPDGMLREPVFVRMRPDLTVN